MKRFRLAALVVFVVLVGMLVTIPNNREPSYQGLTLTQWLIDYDTAKGDVGNLNPARARKAKVTLETSARAIKKIGTNAIPFLLKKLTAKDTAFEQRLKSLLQKQSLIQFQFKDPRRDQRLGTLGFEILGKDAKPATADLIMLTKDPNQATRFYAVGCLYSIEPDNNTLTGC
jgi:hypothetical protein